MKIMVCYDGSREADVAVAQAAEIAKKLSGTVAVVSSVRSEDGAEASRAREGLAKSKKSLDEAQVPCETKLLARDMYPGEDLVLCAQEDQADLVVVGVKNRSKLGKLLLGSVTQHVLLSAPCPVLGVK